MGNDELPLAGEGRGVRALPGDRMQTPTQSGRGTADSAGPVRFPHQSAKQAAREDRVARAAASDAPRHVIRNQIAENGAFPGRNRANLESGWSVL